MKRPVARWAVVLATAQALLAGCGRTGAAEPTTAAALGPTPRAGASPDAPDSTLTVASPAPETPPAAAGGFELAPDAIDIEAFAQRLEPSLVPAPSPDAPSRGPSSAPVTIQVWSDFQCPFCARAVPVLRETEAEFGASVRVVWRNFPLPMHPHAKLAALAAMEVYGARGGAAFWRFHDALFEAADDGLDERVIERLASREGIDPGRLRRAATGTADHRIEADVSAGEAAGVQGTPAFLVNQWRVVGALPYPVFRAVVVRALADAGRR